MRLDDAPAILNHKYYDKYSGKKINEYEWTLLRKLILNEVENLDREFKKSVKKAKSLLIVNKRFHTLFTIKKLWPKLEQDRIVVSTRTMAGATLYKINMSNPVVKKMIEMNNFLCFEYAEKTEKEQEMWRR